ncbi:DNA alkylation repair protein [Bdellovibrio bacteriovorus]|uniref:DNA alkylation repair protein n=1 Tax=Bdellovibrio bacteriovorus TaxID=959 RepID=A0A150WHD1_BDEBC|nr:DNA alkylation repair protein [Bdellovibrio bacteriovorus]KYG62469.1 DNA alkylation repair protein [Bdellovibrio bacteriovorus]
MPQKKKATEETAFKNWINKDLVERIARHIQKHESDFDVKSFVALSAKLSALEMKPRVHLIRDELKKHLPQDYKKSLAILLKATLEPKKGLEPLSGFDLWPFLEFIQTYGLEHTKTSLAALYQLTQVFTAEWAVRPYLIHHEKETLAQLMKWTKDKNTHVRRWVSEGSRPRLPWGEQLKHFIKDPAPTIKLLENLKYDEELYVRKSVANHLNDISKDHPALAVKIATKWKKEAPAKHQAKIDWIVRHALRGQLKKGDPAALKLLGYGTDTKVQLKNLKIEDNTVTVGNHLVFSFELHTGSNVNVMVDYIIHHRKAHGKTSPKVFKLSAKPLVAGQKHLFQKKHSFKVVTTRVYYPGEHVLEIMVNGKNLGKIPFQLKE